MLGLVRIIWNGRQLHKPALDVLQHRPRKLGLVADPVIEAIARLEFEDDLRTGVLPGGCWGP